MPTSTAYLSAPIYGCPLLSFTLKGPPMIFYFIVEEPLFANLQKKFHTLFLLELHKVCTIYKDSFTPKTVRA